MKDKGADFNDAMLADIIKDAPVCSPSEAKELLAKVYETTYGIYNHAYAAIPGKKRPLASVAMHDAEDNGRSSRLYNYIESYFDESIQKHTGLSLQDFLDLPREIATLVYEKCVKINQRVGKAESDAINDMANAARANKK